MSGGEWNPTFDRLHQLVDALEAFRDRPPKEWPPSTPYQPEPRGDLPPLRQRRLPDGRMATEPTGSEYMEIVRTSSDGFITQQARAWFEWRYAQQLAWLADWRANGP